MLNVEVKNIPILMLHGKLKDREDVHTAQVGHGVILEIMSIMGFLVDREPEGN